MKPKINPDYCWYKLRIGRSRIHRWGVFACENIPKNKYVVEYTGELLNRKQHAALVAQNRKHIYTYQLDAKGYWSLDGAVRGSGAERVNHRCDPNIWADIIGKRVFFISLRRIKKGEELTVDYSFDPDETPLTCHCGSRKCRGTMNLSKK